MIMSTLQLEKALAAWPQVGPALRVPHNDREYRRLVKLLDHILDQVREDEAHPLASMMEVIGVLIEKYEDEHVPELETSELRNLFQPHSDSSRKASRNKARAHHSKYLCPG